MPAAGVIRSPSSSVEASGRPNKTSRKPIVPHSVIIDTPRKSRE
jgi:hypothetical protein